MRHDPRAGHAVDTRRRVESRLVGSLHSTKANVIHIPRAARLSIALMLALLACDTLAAVPPEDKPTAASAVAAAPPAAVQAGKRDDASTTQQSHAAPAAVAAQGADATPKQQAVVAAQAVNPADASGFRLMTLSTNALLSRVSLADQATRTIDLQYYIFSNDATGRLIALHLLQAADRGVHVRILIDDLNLVDEVNLFEALASHPRIEVRLFNPFGSARPGALSRSAQMLFHFSRLNRRMHDKSFIVDDEVAVIGGRNIGDPYFDASSDKNFRDLDLLVIGPVVPAATRSFETYWNSAAAQPLHPRAQAVAPAAKGAKATDADVGLVAVRAGLEKDARTFDATAYRQEAANDLPAGASADRPGNWYWGHATLVADDPAKIDAGPERSDLRISPQLQATIAGAQSDVLLISPYFVPSKPEEQRFVALAKRGVAFKVLTNSLASTDEVPVHAGYASHRRALLEGGVQLFELKPTSDAPTSVTDAGRSSGASLHAKAFVVDDRYVFVGSLNMDQRSKLLNTEMGVVVDSPQLAKAVKEFFETATAPANAYNVVLEAGEGSQTSQMHWRTSKDGKDVDYDAEPDTSLHRHVEALLMRALPLEGLL